MLDLIVCGDYFIDLVFTGMPSLPQPGREIWASGFDMLPGGGFNVTAALHRLGATVAWAADFGDDDFSRFVLERVRAEGLRDDLIVRHGRAMRRITVAASYPGDRAFITYADPEPGIPAAMRALARTRARAAYLTGIYCGMLLDAGLLLLRAKRMKLVMDGNSEEDIVLTRREVRKAISSTDVFLPNAAEARRLTGQNDLVSAMTRLGELCPLVVVKDGANGAFAVSDGRIIHEPAISVASVDTTGAGDCFDAGFLKAWLDGQPIRECLRWGNVVGGLSTTARGGTGRVTTASDAREWLSRHPASISGR